MSDSENDPQTTTGVPDPKPNPMMVSGHLEASNNEPGIHFAEPMDSGAEYRAVDKED
ncbi:hypothetical protein LGT39_01545 [Demequina sp. TTPB684]|uniref:hypothetical protein n=1 Tax=unclassified Demequina TaxID=2620311 RepID=UPI001CF34FAE|nr:MULTISPECIES: hypothetical protein [unclassified Demequina]MCB2411532.1 hypothetical protein [Demequina sp. TTPB684]UPU88086.1 hypothetical protein LGT36_012680 [Demequina sp. TMPB413]